MNIEVTHKKLLGLMTEFNEICKENDIHYTLHGGSLLGAIREQGFIPWDDDIDTAMTREDFIKLQKVLENNKNYYIYGDIKKQFRKIGDDELWVDIFVCDYIGTGISRKAKLFSLTALDIMSRDKNSMKLSNLDQYGKGKRIAFKTLYFVGKIIPRTAKVKLYNKIAESRFLGDKTRIHQSNDQFKARSKDFPRGWMEKYLWVPFESEQFSVIENYHEMLVKWYGENYMTPIKDERNKDVHDIVRSLEDGGAKL